MTCELPLKRTKCENGTGLKLMKIADASCATARLKHAHYNKWMKLHHLPHRSKPAWLSKSLVGHDTSHPEARDPPNFELRQCGQNAGSKNPNLSTIPSEEP
eukprot:1157148-Pelagomonas_calceolata.AAC.1